MIPNCWHGSIILDSGMQAQTTGIVSLALIAHLAMGADYRESVALDSKLASGALDPALMCLSIYTDAGVTGWTGPLFKIESMPLDDHASGFHAGLYERWEKGARLLCLAFRGTEINSKEDWKTDLLQALGEEPEQYQLARQRAQTLKAYVIHHANHQAIKATLAGHSLGAGLAAFSGLCWRLPANCFASVPLGEGTQSTATKIHSEALRTAPSYLTHFFIRGDLIPQTALLMGGHFGRIIEPEMELPNAPRSGASGLKVLQLLDLAGLDIKPLTKSGATLQYVADKLARHTCANYVQALLSHASHTPDGLEMLGYWQSKGGFMGVASTNTCFVIKANGALSLENEITVLGDRTYALDQGRWEYEAGHLTVRLANSVILDYGLLAHESSKAVQWHRKSVKPDRDGFLREWQRSKNTDGHPALLLLEGVCFFMKDKTVSWFQADHDLFPTDKP